ncbi:hypothetical protein GGH94_002178 [Coemansia aciculifera]|uniref:beta-aspartyl-peptidase n=1 Tax=Coemansia aciculifera TaxID=417176 RepID=A0A9W8IJW6_9FUNG|nr:hypothetical protein GGH94_002178 [Coemansia aciculifera]
MYSPKRDESGGFFSLIFARVYRLAALVLRKRPRKRQATGPCPTIIIHGGAGTIRKEKMTSTEEKELRAGLYLATERGYAVLRSGGTAADAVEAAVRAMEDNPLFNAGKGAVFNIKGVNQLEASFMDGKTGAAGAATLLTVVKNPITLARKVMESSRHVFLGGAGAEDYAREKGLDIVHPSYFWTKHRWEQHERGFVRSDSASTSSTRVGSLGSDEMGDYSHLPMGTVGAVALDAAGNLATATSTGGMSNKWDGRIGDTPIIGAGTWADKHIAISGTGAGEYFIRQGTAQYIALRAKLLGETPAVAGELAMLEMKSIGGDGGVICVDSTGRLTMTFCSDGMYRGYCSEQTDHIPAIGIFGSEKIASDDNHVALS